jgi:HPt (histidine-containing phosphotransfer) domain-containing protein
MLYDVSGNDIAYIQKMVSTFLENMHPTIKKMELHLNEQDYDNLYKIAHYAKSSLSIIKISDVREQVEKIEKSAKRKTDLPAIGPLLKQVKEKFELAEQLLLQKFASIEK